MGRKHWKKEKLLVTSNFSFSHSVFERLVLHTHKNQGLFGKGLKRDDSQTNSQTYSKVQSSLTSDGQNHFVWPIRRCVAFQIKKTPQNETETHILNAFPNKPLFYAPVSKDWAHIVLPLSVWLSVRLTVCKNLT